MSDRSLKPTEGTIAICVPEKGQKISKLFHLVWFETILFRFGRNKMRLKFKEINFPNKEFSAFIIKEGKKNKNMVVTGTISGEIHEEKLKKGCLEVSFWVTSTFPALKFEHELNHNKN